jgi:hypothetical protein
LSVAILLAWVTPHAPVISTIQTTAGSNGFPLSSTRLSSVIMLSLAHHPP